MTSEVDVLIKKNRKLEKENRELRKQLKCDPKKIRQDALKEGYGQGVAQCELEIQKLKALIHKRSFISEPP